MGEDRGRWVQRILDQATRDAPATELLPNFGRLTGLRSVSGGCVNRADCVETDRGIFFLKTNDVMGAQDVFAAEASGLQALSVAIRVPTPLAWGRLDTMGYLLLEWVPLSARGDEDQLGVQLAHMHTVIQPYFGFPTHNFIGTTPQKNTPSDDWALFYGQHRLQPQLDRAAERGMPLRVIDRGHRLITTLPRFFTQYEPTPALIHGDLWGGNFGFDPTGGPVLYDPAPYFADREAELAMTELFGGFSTRFYAAYQAHAPLDVGYAQRKILYNLYHVLNHFNLFGGHYGHQAAGMIDRLLAETGS